MPPYWPSRNMPPAVASGDCRSFELADRSAPPRPRSYLTPFPVADRRADRRGRRVAAVDGAVGGGRRLRPPPWVPSHRVSCAATLKSGLTKTEIPFRDRGHRAMWDLRILGPVELFAGERRLDLGPAKQRAVLAALAFDTGRVVPVEVLIDRVWDAAPPRTVRNALHTYVLRLRRALDDLHDDGARLEFRDGGYALHAVPERVDLF